MACDLCDATFSAESFDKWCELMKAHYMSTHADFMSENNSKEEGKRWMETMKAKFESL
jgi:hypothetical protein